MSTNNVILLKEGPIPLYFQLKEVLRNQIEKAELKPGELVPSERELIERYQISRPTVRQAIYELVNEGLLIRERGRGTFVAKPKHSQWILESLSSFTEELKEKGLSSTTKVLGLDKVEATIELISIFGHEYKTFYQLERLRYVEGQPAVVVTTYIPTDLALNLENEDLSLNSLYSVLQNNYKFQIGYANRTISAVNVMKEDAVLLEIEPKSAIHLVKTIAFLEDEHPFEYSVSRNRGDLSSFKATLKHKK
jgi:GntR family transcriptional regulator